MSVAKKTLDVHENTVKGEALNIAYEIFCEAQDEIEVIESDVDNM